jgi:hypothetical protein
MGSPKIIQQAQAHGRHLFAANDPVARQHADPRAVALSAQSDHTALDQQIQRQAYMDWSAR